MRFCSQSFVLAVLLVQPVLAQDRPDFSGEWVRVEPTGSPAILTVVETADSLIVKNESAAGPLSVTVPLRGRGRDSVLDGWLLILVAGL